MRTLKLICLITAVVTCQTALADSKALQSQGPLGELQAQIEALTNRIELLESNVSTPDVDGRNYCMMANVTVLRGFSSSATETLETTVARRAAVFSGGAFSATIVSASENVQDDNGVVASEPGSAPVVLSGTYTQSGRQLNIVFEDGSTAAWYASADGSVIYNNSVAHFGPFPNSLSVGVVRSVTFVESETCDGA